MTSYSSKAYSIISAVLCFCLLFSSAASAYVMYAHDMSSYDLEGHHGALVEATSMAAMQHHSHSLGQDLNTADIASLHDCCDNAEDNCSVSGATCAAHCSASVTDADQCLFQLNPSSNFGTEFELANPSFVDLAGPFKPPRK